MPKKGSFYLQGCSLRETFAETTSLGWSASVLSAVAVVIAQLSCQVSFGTNITNAGPLHAMIEVGASVCVSSFFYFHSSLMSELRAIISLSAVSVTMSDDSDA
jgi:hypothetical protein